MRLRRIVQLSILLIAISASCSDDDGPDIALEDVRLSFYDSAGWIHARSPEVMFALEDLGVIETLEYLDQANRGMRLTKDMYFRLDESNMQIVDTAAANGKPGVRYRTCLYTYTGSPLVLALQVSVQNNTYVFESLTRHPIDATRGRWRTDVYAEELVSRASGTMKIYGIFESSDPTREYTWQREGDKFFLNAWSPWSEQQDIRIMMDQRTRAGFLVVREYGLMVFESQWTETGAGTWAEHDKQGNISSSGAWEPAQ